MTQKRFPAYFFFVAASLVWALVAGALWWRREARLPAVAATVSLLLLLALPLRSGYDESKFRT